jgi:hypothetical protein
VFVTRNELGQAPSDKAVINVNGKDSSAIALVGGKDAWIGFIAMKTKVS